MKIKKAINIKVKPRVMTRIFLHVSLVTSNKGECSFFRESIFTSKPIVLRKVFIIPVYCFVTSIYRKDKLFFLPRLPHSKEYFQKSKHLN